jgi:transposase
MGTYVGIDISKSSFDVVVHHTGEYRHFEYNDDGTKDCVQWLVRLKPSLVLMEATGGYEVPLATELAANSVPVKQINPRRIRDFARSLGKLAKTDKIDAIVIAKYAAIFQPPPREVIDKLAVVIKALASRRRQLMEMRTQEKNRREHARDNNVVKSLAAVIGLLDKEIAKLDAQISKDIDSSSSLKKKRQLFESVPGIGNQTAMLLVCQLPELGTCSRREIAALVGLAPINRDSGMFRGKRMIGGGRKHVRQLLYMPTLVAIRHNKRIANYYRQLLDAGKEKMVAVTACTRKLLTILNSMARTQDAWKQIEA